MTAADSFAAFAGPATVTSVVTAAAKGADATTHVDKHPARRRNERRPWPEGVVPSIVDEEEGAPAPRLASGGDVEQVVVATTRRAEKRSGFRDRDARRATTRAGASAGGMAVSDG